MKVQDVIEEDWLKMTDFENFFDVVKDKRENYVYNLNETMYLDVDESQTLEHVLDHDSHWTLISYKIYGTTRLAWFLMKLNKIDEKNALDVVRAGSVVKFVPEKMAQTAIRTINDYGEY